MRAATILGLLLLIIGGFAVNRWVIPKLYEERARPYRAAFAAGDAKYGLPPGLLARVAYQESRYNKDAVSPVGAVGIMQFMPATARDFGLDPRDPLASIDAAGKYLKQLYSMFRSWPMAIAAYNWGPGNMNKHIAKYGRLNIAQLPNETRQYLSIANDIGVA